MGKVYLVPNHQSFDDEAERLTLTDEMLSWPICKGNRRSGNLDRPLVKMFRNVFQSLISLDDNFETVFCMQANQEKRFLYLARRTWVTICFNGIHIKTFRFLNYPSISLKWSERNNYESIVLWGMTQWKTFFINRIKDETSKTLMAAKYDLAAAELTMKKANDRLKEQQKQTEAVKLAMKNIEGGRI